MSSIVTYNSRNTTYINRKLMCGRVISKRIV